MSGYTILGYFIVRRRRKLLRRKWTFFLFFVFMIWYIDCLPDKLFNDSTSTVILDRNGELLGAHIASDEQWRFPDCEKVPSKFKTCIIQYEDRGFYDHWGVSPKGVARAFWQNMSSGQRVSGGSTLTMQLVRLMRKNPPRTYSEKVYEMILATRVEWRYSKDEILRLYASHAPFGNNVVGIDAASWRFFGRSSDKLSWAESATLAVLPNAPGLIYPGRNHDLLKAKRDRLLKRLKDIGKISTSEYELAVLEELPSKPHRLPNIAPHLLQKCIKEGRKGQVVRTTVDARLQEQTVFMIDKHATLLRDNGIFNGSVMVTSVSTGEVLAYVGNISSSGREHANEVNCIDASRSTGSILKPLLYGKALESGTITPTMLLRDVPSRFGNFNPKNFAGTYEGLIPADEALSRSLNIPMVHLLRQYGLPKFHGNLKSFGFTTIRKGASHYGLSLILGGAEINMYDLNGVYTRMAQKLRNEESYSLRLFKDQPRLQMPFKMEKSCIYSTFEAMLDVKRPDEDNNWHMFSSSTKIAWKTGTSYGFRDAWAVGVTPEYVVSVWVGNADGEGRPGLTGIRSAAPLLFDIFGVLRSNSSWFHRPEQDMAEIEVCAESGHRVSSYCQKSKKEWVPKTTLRTFACPYHQRVHINEEGLRVNSSCASVDEMKHENWFVIAPDIEEYYKKHHPLYKPLPAYDSSCDALNDNASLAIRYPIAGQKMYLPVAFDEERQSVVFEASHLNPNAILFWHIDGNFIGQTSEIHQLTLQPDVGKHVLTVYDTEGEKRKIRFEIVGSRKAAN